MIDRLFDHTAINITEVLLTALLYHAMPSHAMTYLLASDEYIPLFLIHFYVPTTALPEQFRHFSTYPLTLNFNAFYLQLDGKWKHNSVPQTVQEARTQWRWQSFNVTAGVERYRKRPTWRPKNARLTSICNGFRLIPKVELTHSLTHSLTRLILRMIISGTIYCD